VAIAPVVVVQRAVAVIGSPASPPETKSLTTPGGFVAPTPGTELATEAAPTEAPTRADDEDEPEVAIATDEEALPLAVRTAPTPASPAAAPADGEERLSDPALELEPTSAATELAEDEAEILLEEAASLAPVAKAPPAPPILSKPPAPPPPKAPPPAPQAPPSPSASAPSAGPPSAGPPSAVPPSGGPPTAVPPSGGPPSAAPQAAPSVSVEERTALHSRPPKKKPQWWEELFNDDYLRTVPVPSRKDIARQCDFIEQRLGLAQGAAILDVGCGLGLHAIELTRRGFVVVGLDLSLPMLSRAADEAQDQGFKINFLHADMREMNFEGAFDAVLLWGTTLGYFDDDTNRQVLERIYRALKPGGLLLIEAVNRDYAVRTQPNLVWFQGDGCVVMEETSFNFIASRLAVKRNVILDDGRQKESHYSIRLYALHELGLVLHKGGFRVVEVSGRESTPGIYFGADSPKLIILAERRLQAPQPLVPPAPPKKPGEDGPKTGETPTPGEG
jgi:SAM-dependent methyltransferase